MSALAVPPVTKLAQRRLLGGGGGGIGGALLPVVPVAQVPVLGFFVEWLLSSEFLGLLLATASFLWFASVITALANPGVGLE